MKKKLDFKIFAMLLAGWFVVMVSVVIGVYVYKHKQAAEYDVLAVPYIKQVVPKLSQWDPGTTRELMAPEAFRSSDSVWRAFNIMNLIFFTAVVVVVLAYRRKRRRDHE